MADVPFDTTHLRNWLARFRQGDPAALSELIERATERLRRLVRKMLKSSPGVRRWEETDDVLQTALMRLVRALKTEAPADTQAFFGLAALQVRRELIDLARHYHGPCGLGANHASNQVGNGETTPYEPSDLRAGPSRVAELIEFHEQIDSLPQEERDVVDQLHYLGFTREEVADNLGLSIRTVYRLWQSARLKLHRLLKDE